jgi:hypothetical protein
MDGVNTDKSVPQKTVFGLTAYLIVSAVVAGYTFVELWSAQQQSVGNPPPAACTGIAGPAVTNVYPDRVGPGSPEVTVIGCNLPPTTTVKYNGSSHPAMRMDANRIRIGLTPQDTAAAGTVILTLANAGADFGTGFLTVGPASVYWNFLGMGPWPLSADVQLLLMALIIGSFGSSVYALKSLADYRGENKLFESWVSFYIVQPFEGAGVATLLYLVVRGGFLAGSGGDTKSINQFGICAIAGLAGAFSDTALMKLREVFLTLFKPQDDRGGKQGPKIAPMTLPDGSVGEAYEAKLQATGGTGNLIWSVTPALPKGLALDGATGKISGTPAAELADGKFKFTVTDSGTPPASVSIDLALKIGKAKFRVTTASLTAATIGKVYTGKVESANGTGAVTWTVDPSLPAGMTLDAATGAIGGTATGPAEKKEHTFTATDSTKATAASKLTLEVAQAAGQGA